MLDWRDHAKHVTPMGAQTRSKKDLFPDPVAIIRAKHSQVWDDQGRRYTDWISGLCAVGLGHQHPMVDYEVRAQVGTGVCLPLPSRLEVDVAEDLMLAIGYGDGSRTVRWVSTGSEATGGAMLIAWQATGRRIILSIGYHGWHPGHIPGYGVSQLEWGNLRELELAMRSDVAGVLIEPMRDHAPPAGYLEGAQALCRQHRSVFIVDEIVTGFRWRIGGATEFFGLDPDIQCFSKAMANGYRCAAIVGKRAVMEHAEGVSSTYGGECVGLAATRATIKVYQTEGVIERLWATGATLMAEMAKAGYTMSGYPVHPRFQTTEIPYGAPWVPIPKDVRELSHRMAARGVLAHPAGFNPTAAHTPEDITQAVESLQ